MSESIGIYGFKCIHRIHRIYGISTETASAHVMVSRLAVILGICKSTSSPGYFDCRVPVPLPMGPFGDSANFKSAGLFA